ncbi:MAG: hypothetical protein R3200_12180, partial [Xanthomonadales bacterium]|nr:hypothetical protein [Xanthomonadales bacterium]
MRVGDSAGVERAFSAADLEAYRALGGEPAVDQVPDPLIGALFSYLLGMQLPGLGTMYLKQETEFRAAAAPGEVVRATVRITRLRPEKHLADLATECHGADGRLLAEGRALVYTRDV